MHIPPFYSIFYTFVNYMSCTPSKTNNKWLIIIKESWINLPAAYFKGPDITFFKNMAYTQRLFIYVINVWTCKTEKKTWRK